MMLCLKNKWMKLKHLVNLQMLVLIKKKKDKEEIAKSTVAVDPFEEHWISCKADSG